MFIPGCICNANTICDLFKTFAWTHTAAMTNDHFVTVKSVDSALVLLMVAQS